MGRGVEAGQVPLVKKAITNSSIESVKASSEPAATAGAINGRVTRRKVVISLAPKSSRGLDDRLVERFFSLRAHHGCRRRQC